MPDRNFYLVTDKKFCLVSAAEVLSLHMSFRLPNFYAQNVNRNIIDKGPIRFCRSVGKTNLLKLDIRKAYCVG